MWKGLFNGVHRTTPCDICGSESIEIKVSNKTFSDGSVDEIYEEICVNCRNLLFGWVKKVEGSKLMTINKKVEKNEMQRNPL